MREGRGPTIHPGIQQRVESEERVERARDAAGKGETDAFQLVGELRDDPLHRRLVHEPQELRLGGRAVATLHLFPRRLPHAHRVAD